MTAMLGGLAELLTGRNGLDALSILGMGACLMVLLLPGREGEPLEEPVPVRTRRREEAGLRLLTSSPQAQQTYPHPSAEWGERLSNGARRYQAVPRHTWWPDDATTARLQEALSLYYPEDHRAAAVTARLTRPLDEIDAEDLDAAWCR